MRFELTTRYKISDDILENFDKIVKAISKMENLPESTFFELHIVNIKKITTINKLYRKIDKPTDVISFSFWENSDIKSPLLGEIFISFEKAKLQAKEYGHSFEKEICFLLIHGVLHLLGYDHIQKKDEKIMFEKQKLVMNEISIK